MYKTGLDIQSSHDFFDVVQQVLFDGLNQP